VPGGSGSRPLRIVFVMRHPEFARNWEWVLRELVSRGHYVHLGFELDRADRSVVAQLTREFPDRITQGFVPVRHDMWHPISRALGQSIDYLRYLAPVYRDASFLRERAAKLTPAAAVRLASAPLLRTSAGRALLSRVMGVLERAVPPLPELADVLRDHEADVLLVTPVVSQPTQHALMRSAHAAGYPVVLAVNSWDNLTNKGLVRELPDRTYVWNEAQRAEAVDLHGIPGESVAVVGAHTFDHWFAWRPKRDRETFCMEVGLDPERPFLLYACSSLQIAGDERPFVRRWLAAVRATPGLGEVGVLVRPHPTAAGTWDDAPVLDDANAVVWPTHGANPQDEARRADYYDSLFHSAAVVGLNTSALIEAAIVGRRTYSVVVEDERNAQEGTLHFQHLLRENGGPLTVARTLEENVGHLARVEDETGADGWQRSFLQSFVRPHGLDRPAAPLFVDDLEQFVASAAPVRTRRRRALGPAVLAPVAWLLHTISYGRPDRRRRTRTAETGVGWKRRPPLRKRLRRRKQALRKALGGLRRRG
jgi:hypothetical protein